MEEKKVAEMLTVSGWALVTVFIVTVAFSALPMQVANPAWGGNLSRLIVDAASLPLVGLCMVRYGVYMHTLNSNVGDVRILRTSRRVSSLAGVGSIALTVLALWQVALFIIALPDLDQQLAAARTQALQQSDSVVEGINAAEPSQIMQIWEQLRVNSPQSPSQATPSIEKQRQELVSQAQSKRKEAVISLQRQAGNARLQLGRDLLRVMVVALVYAWAFLVVARRR
jgi:hypothetical protein